MPDAANVGRINIWRNSTVAASAATEAPHEIEAFGRMTIYRNGAAARSRRHHEMPSGGGGGGSYTASAVHFDGSAYLSIDSLTATDGADFSMVFWFKVAAFSGGILFVVDPNNAYSSFCEFNADFTKLLVALANSAGNNYFTTRSSSSNYVDAWHCLIYSGNTNHDAGEKVAKYYLDDVDVTDVFQDLGAAFPMVFDGLPFFVGDDGLGDPIEGDFADIRIMPGTSLLQAGDIPEAKRRLFIDGSGKPVDPAVATAALGAPCILFSGNASTFGTNQGTGGAFTLTGSLTNATTSPSG